MDKRAKKLWALLAYTFGIIIIQWFFIHNLENWRLVLFGIFFFILNLAHVFTILDIKIQFPFSRRWYYILLSAFTIGFFIFILKYL